MPITFVEGWTYPIEYVCLSCGSPVDLSGCTVTIDILTARGRASTSTGEVTVYDSTGGKVRFIPASTGDFRRSYSPYSVRFHVLDGSGHTAIFPSAVEPEHWTVGR